MASKDDPQRHDIHVGVLFHGFGVWLGMALLAILLTGLAFEGFSLKAVSENPALLFVPIALSAITLIVTGYATANMAYYEEVPANLHVIVLGFFFMLLHLAANTLPVAIVHPAQANLQLYSRFFMLFTIPLMLIGARWAMRNVAASKQVKSWLTDDAPGKDHADSAG